jgi:hypothetical protein
MNVSSASPEPVLLYRRCANHDSSTSPRDRTAAAARAGWDRIFPDIIRQKMPNTTSMLQPRLNATTLFDSVGINPYKTFRRNGDRWKL